MSVLPSVTFRASDDLIRELDEWCLAHGLTRSKGIVAAIASRLAMELPEMPPAEVERVMSAIPQPKPPKPQLAELKASGVVKAASSIQYGPSKFAPRLKK